MALLHFAMLTRKRNLIAPVLLLLALALIAFIPHARAEDENPGHLYDIWGFSDNDIFAVGYQGRILHYDGTAWSEMDSGTDKSLWGSWGSSPTDVFACGQAGTLLHYDGTAWTSMTSPTDKQLLSMWGSSASDIYGVGVEGTLLHYDGTAWSSVFSYTTNTLRGIWGHSASDIFVVGNIGTVLYWNGEFWESMNTGTETNLHGVWGTSPDNVYVTGEEGIILHYDGSSWTEVESLATGWLNDLCGSGPDDIYVVGQASTLRHFDGTSFKPMGILSNSSYWDVWVASPSSIWAVGNLELIAHCDGIRWSVVEGYAEQEAYLKSIAPREGKPGNTLNLTISGRAISGPVTLDMGPGITIDQVVPDTSMMAKATIRIDTNAVPGPRDATLSTDQGEATLPAAFTVIEEQQAESSSCSCGSSALSTPTQVATGWSLVGGASLGVIAIPRLVGRRRR